MKQVGLGCKNCHLVQERGVVGQISLDLPVFPFRLGDMENGVCGGGLLHKKCLSFCFSVGSEFIGLFCCWEATPCSRDHNKTLLELLAVGSRSLQSPLFIDVLLCWSLIPRNSNYFFWVRFRKKLHLSVSWAMNGIYHRSNHMSNYDWAQWDGPAVVIKAILHLCPTVHFYFTFFIWDVFKLLAPFLTPHPKLCPLLFFDSYSGHSDSDSWIKCAHVSTGVQIRAVVQSSGPSLPVSSPEYFTSFTQHI